MFHIRANRGRGDAPARQGARPGTRDLGQYRASDGVRIAYRDEGAGRPLVFLHGLLAHKDFFRDQQALALDFRLIRVDLRGHGESVAPAEGLTVERLAEDVAGLVEALDLRGAIGIGWSLGASVLWHVLAGAAADRFDGAVVVDMTARVMNDSSWSLGLDPDACEARSAAMKADFQTFAAQAGQAIFAQPVSAERQADADYASAEFARNDPAAIAALWQSLVALDARPLLGRVDHPTLVIHGAKSQLYDAATADHLVRALPNARAVEFAASGHAPQIEEPELFNRTITAFADELSRTSEPQKLKI
jgi:pimeloyl-ACP methyl ester carboxylesterase